MAQPRHWIAQRAISGVQCRKLRRFASGIRMLRGAAAMKLGLQQLDIQPWTTRQIEDGEGVRHRPRMLSMALSCKPFPRDTLVGGRNSRAKRRDFGYSERSWKSQLQLHPKPAR